MLGLHHGLIPQKNQDQHQQKLFEDFSLQLWHKNYNLNQGLLKIWTEHSKLNSEFTD